MVRRAVIPSWLSGVVLAVMGCGSPPAAQTAAPQEVVVSMAPAPPAPAAAASAAAAAESPTEGVDEDANPEASQLGVIGLLKSAAGGDLTAPWARLDSDDGTARGGLFGAATGEGIGGSGLGLGSAGGRLGGSGRSAAPAVRLGAASVSGKLPPEVIQRIVRQNFGRYRLCYENGLKKNASLAGRVAVRFTIGTNGAVSQVSNAGSDIPDKDVVSCVVRSFYGLSFPKPDAGVVTVVYPIVFVPPPAGTPAPAPAPSAAPTAAPATTP